VALAAGCATHAQPPTGYYANAEGKTGLALKSALHDIIDDHTVFPYSSGSFDTHDALQVLDQDPANSNNVILIYARRSEPKWERLEVEQQGAAG